MFQKCKKVTARTRVSRRTVSRILKEGENAKLVSQLQFHLHVTEAEVLHKKFSGCLEEKKNSVALVRERTIPTERPPPVGEFSANFCG